MRRRPPMRDPEDSNEFAMIAIPIIVEAVGAVVFIACAMLLVVVLATPVAPV